MAIVTDRRKGVYTTAIMVWSFLSQVVRDGKEASCQAAVARVVSYCQMQGLQTPTEDTGDYCRARAKLSSAALRDLSCEVAEEVEQTAEPKWLWKGKLHAKLVDGFTFTMPDTPKNQAMYPQRNSTLVPQTRSAINRNTDDCVRRVGPNAVSATSVDAQDTPSCACCAVLPIKTP